MRIHRKFLASITLALLITEISARPFQPLPPSPVQQSQDIRKLNLKRVAYRDAMKLFRSYWGGGVKESDVREFTAETVYGNLTGGRSTEAAVTASYTLGGSGEFTGLFVYTLRAGRPVLIGRMEGGDRAHGAIKSVRIQGGKLIVERYRPNKEGCMACYGYVEVATYEWRADRFVRTGSQRRELPKAKRGN